MFFQAFVRHLGGGLAVVAIPALLANGCGGNPLDNGNQAANDTQNLKWAQCMQQHGITGAFANGNSSGIRQRAGDPNAPSQQTMQAAQQACKQYRPNGGQASRKPSAQQLDQEAKYAQCMTQHGVPTQANPNGGIESNASGVSDATQTAADKACQQYSPGH